MCSSCANVSSKIQATYLQSVGFGTSDNCCTNDYDYIQEPDINYTITAGSSLPLVNPLGATNGRDTTSQVFAALSTFDHFKL